jgi:hypothetical protein
MVLPHHLATFRDQLWLLFMIPNTSVGRVTNAAEDLTS